MWFETGAKEFLGNHALSEEIFGPSSLVIWCDDRAELMAVARQLEGSLTATVQAGASESKEVASLADVLAERAGRLILNGYPTGLEVSHAQVHGGPYPSTSDGGRSTSVGTRALIRWARLICYQSFSDALLPPELQNANPLGLARMINGQVSRDPVR
jgi:NADP-dependent aldehyde dehydrogenase